MTMINKKIVYRIELKFVTPINVSSGYEGTTDSDVMTDFEGKPFIPGSSLAGAFRAYAETKNKSDADSLFGYTKMVDGNDGGKMSSLFISDLTFEGEPKRIIRDSVALDDNKISQDGAKFDFEALEGETTKGYFYMEVTIRDVNKEQAFTKMIDDIFRGINSHEIRLGSKKTRGYGIVKIEDLKKKVFEGEGYLDYAGCYDEDKWTDKDKYTVPDVKDSEGNYVHIEVPLKLTGGISIRQYAVKKNSPDFEHITDHGKAVIPGTSFMGAIRHRIKEILKTLSKDSQNINVDKMLDLMFGYVNGQEAHISNVVIDEAVIEGAKPLTITRTGVSRFESSAKNGALYQEKTYVGGNLTLNISVKKDINNEDWMVGILLLAIKDLQNGFLAVGGQTSVGRGIFEANDKVKINGKSISDETINTYIAKSLTKYQEVYDHAR